MKKEDREKFYPLYFIKNTRSKKALCKSDYKN